MAEKEQKKRGGCLKWIVIIFGLLILLGACGAMLSGGGDSTDTTTDEAAADNNSKTDETAEETESDEESSNETEDTAEVIEEETETVDNNLTVGETSTIDDISLTVDNAYYTDQRNEFADIVPDNVLMIDVTIENNSGTDYPVGMDLSLYVDGSKAETYPVATLMDSVSDGRSVSGQQSFAIMGDSSEIELEFSPFMSFSGEKAIYTITPQ